MLGEGVGLGRSKIPNPSGRGTHTRGHRHGRRHGTDIGMGIGMGIDIGMGMDMDIERIVMAGVDMAMD